MSAGDWVCERYAEARRSSTIVLSSRIASSTSVLARRREPGREEGAVLARFLDGEGRRESTRAGERVPEVRERRIVGFSKMDADALVGSSGQADRLGVCIVAIVVPERRRSCVLVVPLLFWLCVLERLECETDAEDEEDETGLRWMRYSDVEGFDDMEFVRESLWRTSACAGFSRSTFRALQTSSSSKSGNGERRPHPLGR